MMKSNWRVCLPLLGACLLSATNLYAQRVDERSHQSILEALQHQAATHPPVFPLASSQNHIQSIPDGLRNIYFGYGERRYIDHTDFHPAMDAGYFPRETGEVKAADGKTWTIRSPQSYLKKIFAIQKGLLFSAAENISGYKIILKHSLEKPYQDDQGRVYHEYFTSYRHVDSRSMDHLNRLAKAITGNEQASVEDIIGKHIFEAGELIGFSGFDPNSKVVLPRAHLDFSLHVFLNAKKGTNIRKYSLNPLIIFPAFQYANPETYEIGMSGLPAYHFVVSGDNIVAPTENGDGKFLVEIPAGGLSAQGAYVPSRYFALNAIQVRVNNNGRELAGFNLNRDQRLGYDTSSYQALDTPDTTKPYFNAPLDEQNDVYRMEVVLPKSWFREIGYDWSGQGSVSIRLSSVWDGYLDGHYHDVEIPLPGN